MMICCHFPELKTEAIQNTGKRGKKQTEAHAIQKQNTQGAEAPS